MIARICGKLPHIRTTVGLSTRITVANQRIFGRADIHIAWLPCGVPSDLQVGRSRHGMLTIPTSVCISLSFVLQAVPNVFSEALIVSNQSTSFGSASSIQTPLAILEFLALPCKLRRIDAKAAGLSSSKCFVQNRPITDRSILISPGVVWRSTSGPQARPGWLGLRQRSRLVLRQDKSSGGPLPSRNKMILGIAFRDC